MAAARAKPGEGEEKIAIARKLSKAERILALCLAAIWIAAGCAALAIALVHSRWFTCIIALAAVGYGIAWLRVALFARLLTWPELFTPWRSGR
ncbi:MAG TPA: hypothetical protein VK580_19735 [Steroidobacteraceae bacterium]|nr:hypothetical protein [Steroidobacteraceae bacterium]